MKINRLKKFAERTYKWLVEKKFLTAIEYFHYVLVANLNVHQNVQWLKCQSDPTLSCGLSGSYGLQ